MCLVFSINNVYVYNVVSRAVHPAASTSGMRDDNDSDGTFPPLYETAALDTDVRNNIDATGKHLVVNRSLSILVTPVSRPSI